MRVLVAQTHAQLQQKMVPPLDYLMSDVVVVMFVALLTALVVVMEMCNSKVPRPIEVASVVAAVVSAIVALAMGVGFESARIHYLEEAN